MVAPVHSTVCAHRLWECYLAHKTGYRATRGHAQAEPIEHALSIDDTHVLASRCQSLRLGYETANKGGAVVGLVC